MTYYRLALQERQTGRWGWKTTPLTSLQAVFQLLRITTVLPQDGIRVFTSSSREELSEMLRRENQNLVSGSVTAAQFLQARKIAGRKQAQSTSEEQVSRQTVQQATDSVAQATWETHMVTQAAQQGADSATWARELWEKHQAARAAQQGASGVPTSSQRVPLATTGVPTSLAMGSQEMKRLEIELGSAGDHDTQYLFTLPISQKERLAWIRLQKQVQAGELRS